MEKDIIKSAEWQRKFVNKLVEMGLTHDHAMIAMGLCCEERLNAYIQGCNAGFDSGFKNQQEIGKEKIEKRNNEVIESLNNARMHIEGDYRLKAHGSISNAIDLLLDGN